jgi:hypothetical protein
VAPGLCNLDVAPLLIDAEYADFDDYWQPFLAGAGPGGAYCIALDPNHQAALGDECYRRLGAPQGSFRLTARAWAIRGSTT